jgi:outer membrane beta-barrel protein
MRTTAFLAVIAIAFPCVATAQAGTAAEPQEMGLDLSKPADDSAKKAEAKKAEEKKAEAKKPEEVPGLDLSKPPAPKPSEAAQPAAKDAKKPATGSPLAAQDPALGDKVKAVQKKGFLKRGRFEIAPTFAFSVNDAFYQKFGGGLRLAYSLQDSFALAVRGTYFTPYRTEYVRDGKLAFQSQLLSSQLYRQAMVDGVWSPIYGKAAFLEKSIVHFDVYLSAGFGLVWSATSFSPRNEGPHLATDFGGGVRFYPKSWLAFELGLLATLYNDQPILSVPGTVQKVFVANVGFSFFLPPSFDYVYP